MNQPTLMDRVIDDLYRTLWRLRTPADERTFVSQATQQVRNSGGTDTDVALKLIELIRERLA